MDNEFQKYINLVNDVLQQKRMKEHVLLGELIVILKACQPNAIVLYNSPIGVEFCFPTLKACSYRGYYQDLCLIPESVYSEIRVEEFLKLLEDCVNMEFTGYKGGEYVMGYTTPLWVAPYGNTGMKVVSANQIKTDGTTSFVIITLKEDDDNVF